MATRSRLRARIECSMSRTWEPISREALDAKVASDLDAASDEERARFASVAIPPQKWSQSPWGDEGGGFWAVAVHGDRVLWYNDIEEGFNVSCFETRGRSPDDEYWCNQDSLGIALRSLTGEFEPRLGPPEPVRE